jgi:hypothetical protein
MRISVPFKAGAWTLAKGAGSAAFPVPGLKPGVYFVRVVSACLHVLVP